MTAPTEACIRVITAGIGGLRNGVRGHIAEQQYSAMNVRFGSEADIQRRSTNVRFTPESGHRRQRLGRPLSARSVRCRRRRQLLRRHTLDVAMAVRVDDNPFKRHLDLSTVRIVGG
jgi:hypothetical protein